MVSLETTQGKLRNATKLYKSTYQKDYEAVVEICRQKRDTNKNKTGSLEGDHVMERALVEYPEDLDILFIQNLDEEEYNWFGTTEGKRWFAKEFPEFRIAHEI